MTGAKWRTHRGDEWWYEAADLDAEGLFTTTYPMQFSIGTMTPKFGRLTPESLHSLLWSTRLEFPDAQLLCDLDRAISALLESLTARGLVRWEKVTSIYLEQARILEVLSPDTR